MGRGGQRDGDGYDLVEDILLAALLEAGHENAPAAFDRRFAVQLKRWAKDYAKELIICANNPNGTVILIE